MVGLNLGGPMLVFTVVGGGIFLIGLAMYGYYRYSLEMAKSGGKTALRESGLDKREAELERKKTIAARGDINLANMELQNEAYLMREEFQKLDLCKLLAERAKIIERIGFNATDPRWQQVPILSSTMGILQQLQRVVSTEIGQTKQLLKINEKKTRLDSIQKKIDASELRLKKKMEGMEKIEMRAESIEEKHVGKQLRPILRNAKNFEKKAIGLLRKQEQLLKRDANEERIKLKIEQKEHQLIQQFEKQQELALKEMARIYGILRQPANRSTVEVTRELRRLMAIFRGAENILKKVFILHRDEIKIFAKILGERVLLEREQVQIENLLISRDKYMQMIAEKERKVQVAKEWAIAKQKGLQITAEMKQVESQTQQERNKLRAELAEAEKQINESGRAAEGFALFERAIR